MKLMKLPKLQSGLSMIEIMIAMLIGLFLMGGLVQMFITTKSTNKIQDAVSRVQENGRFAMEFITQDVRMADYFMECTTSTTNPNAITGTNDDTTETNVVNGTDTITITRTEGECANRQTTTIRYFINIGPNGQPSLYRTTTVGVGAPDTDELVEGIENMQILYRMDSNPKVKLPGQVDYYYYVPASAIASVDWDDVVGISISLLARSVENNVTTQPIPYIYNGTAITPSSTDLRIRRVYNSTIALRNRFY